MQLATFGLACVLLAFGPAASAQVTAIVTGGTTTVTLGNGRGPVTNAPHNSARQIADPAANEAANYQVVSNLTPNDITFGNNASAEGAYSAVTSNTRLKITFKNDGTHAVVPQISSMITPGGFGFYTAIVPNPSGTSIGDINTSVTNQGGLFSDFGNTGDTDLAEAGFSVNIASGNTSIESFDELLTMGPTQLGGVAPNVSLIGNASSSLNNFGLVTPTGSSNEVGYQWSATTILLTLPGGPLQPGQRRTITYDTSIFSSTNGSAGCTGSSCAPYQLAQLFAFGGFGDPLGKSVGSGGSNGIRASGAETPGDSGIDGVTFSRFSFGLPTFDSDTGMLSLPVSSTLLPSLPLTSAVPEPGPWALMLFGVGFVGLTLRRRRTGPAGALPI